MRAVAGQFRRPLQARLQGVSTVSLVQAEVDVCRAFGKVAVGLQDPVAEEHSELGEVARGGVG